MRDAPRNTRSLAGRGARTRSRRGGAATAKGGNGASAGIADHVPTPSAAHRGWMTAGAEAATGEEKIPVVGLPARAERSVDRLPRGGARPRGAMRQVVRVDRGPAARLVRPARGGRKAAADRAGRRGRAEAMRIVGGRLKGRTLASPTSRAVRPTSDRLRESIFDILEHRFPGSIEGRRALDLFAGAGALGIEALSRGARFALFVDSGVEARALLRANVEALALGGVSRIWRANATRLGKAPAGGPFGLAFLDPPYGQDLAGPALAGLVRGGWLEPDAICVVEEAARAEITAPEGLEIVDQRTYGETRIAILVPIDGAVVPEEGD